MPWMVISSRKLMWVVLGSANGACKCGRCVCKDGWTGRRCDCSTDVSKCRSKTGVGYLHFRQFLSERSLFAVARPVCLSVGCLSVVCNVRAPYSGGWNFRQYFYGIRYLGHPLTYTKNFTENPSVGGVKHNRRSQIQRFWTYRRLDLGNGAR